MISNSVSWPLSITDTLFCPYSSSETNINNKISFNNIICLINRKNVEYAKKKKGKISFKEIVIKITFHFNMDIK